MTATDTLRRMQSFLAIAAYLCGLLALAAGPAMATDDPEAWLRKIYGIYVKEETPPAAIDLIKPEASARLLRLIRSDEACMKKNGGAPCMLDFDVFGNGQDFKIDNVAAYTVRAKDKIDVIMRYTNFGEKQETSFTFIPDGKGWRLDDAMGRTSDGTTWQLAKLLAAKK